MAEKAEGWLRAVLFYRENGTKMIPACSRPCYNGMGGSPVSEGYFSPTSHVLSGLLFQLSVVSRALY